MALAGETFGEITTEADDFQYLYNNNKIIIIITNNNNLNNNSELSLCLG